MKCLDQMIVSFEKMNKTVKMQDENLFSYIVKKSRAGSTSSLNRLNFIIQFKKKILSLLWVNIKKVI